MARNVHLSQLINFTRTTHNQKFQLVARRADPWVDEWYFFHSTHNQLIEQAADLLSTHKRDGILAMLEQTAFTYPHSRQYIQSLRWGTLSHLVCLSGDGW